MPRSNKYVTYTTVTVIQHKFHQEPIKADIDFYLSKNKVSGKAYTCTHIHSDNDPYEIEVCLQGENESYVEGTFEADLGWIALMNDLAKKTGARHIGLHDSCYP